MLNAGAARDEPERIHADKSVAEEFAAKLAREIKATRHDDPSGNDELDMGPGHQQDADPDEVGLHGGCAAEIEER